VTPAVPRWCWAVAAGTLPVAWLLARLGHGMATPTPLRDLVWLVLLAAAEEAVFRGGLQAALTQRPAFAASRWALSGANVLTSVVFSAAHLWGHTPLQAAGVFPISLLLGASFEQSRRLRVPIALHIGFNAALYAASWMQAGR
jgi:membrane protease YdiL (CAAX protease family)